MAKKTGKADVVVVVPQDAFAALSTALAVCQRVALLEETTTFAEFEAKMDRLIEDARLVSKTLKGRAILLAIAEEVKGN